MMKPIGTRGGLMEGKKLLNTFLTVLFSAVSILYVYPLLVILINSFKVKAYISRAPFALPLDKMFAAGTNYVNGIAKTNFFDALKWSFVITVLSVFVILLCTSMCAWFISRVHNRWSRAIYFLCIFSMVVPFQMVMFTLSKTANMLGLTTPIGIVVVYLGFGAGLAVFMFSGFMRSNSRAAASAKPGAATSSSGTGSSRTVSRSSSRPRRSSKRDAWP